MLVNLKFLLQRHAARIRRARLSLQSAGVSGTIRRVLATGSHSDYSAADCALDERDGEWDGAQPWILVVDSMIPTPDRDSGSIRLVNLIRLLIDGGHNVVFIADDNERGGTQADALRAMGVHVPRLQGALSISAWVRRHAGTLQTAILCRHYVAAHWLELVRAAAPHSTVVFDTVDLHFLREQREARLRGSQAMLRLAIETERRELALIARADVVWVVSHVEQALLRELAPDANVQVLSNIIEADEEGAPFEQREGLLFVGGMSHPPNRDAVRWLATEIYPAIRRLLPDVELHLVGVMTDEIRIVIEQVEGVRVHGHVARIEPFVSRCRIALAPLRFGAGVKGKINLSMAYGQPVVATSCAVEGMHLRSGEDVLVADDAQEFAAEVARLYRDASLWHALAEAGRANVRTHFSPDAARSVLEVALRRRQS